MDTPPPLSALQWAELAAARAAFRLPRSLKRRIAGPPRHSDGLELDLDMQLLLRLQQLSATDLDSVEPAEARSNMTEASRVGCGRPDPIARVERLTIAGADDALAARLYVPAEVARSREPGPLLVYYHGGGWVTGDLDTHDVPCRLLANGSGMRVLAVDYRRSPEHPFPAPIDDALAAFRDAVERADELAVDSKRIAVGGDSAGGHLAAVVSLLAARDGGPAPAFQLLIYPVTDCLEVSESRQKFAEGYVLSRANMEWYERQLLAGGGDRADARVSPLRAPDLSGLCPALMISAGFDILRDEDEAYAARLEQSGVRTILRRHSGYTHGFVNMLGLWPGPREALAEVAGILRSELRA